MDLEGRYACSSLTAIIQIHFLNRYIVLFFRQRNIHILYFVRLVGYISTLEGHHQMLQITYLQLLICNVTLVLHISCFQLILNSSFGCNTLRNKVKNFSTYVF
jgi:hypothetical protein